MIKTYIYPSFLPNPMRGPICWSIRPVSGSYILMLRSPSSYSDSRFLKFLFWNFWSMCTFIYCLHYLNSNYNLRNVYFAFILVGWVEIWKKKTRNKRHLDWSGSCMNSKWCLNLFLQHKFCRWALNKQYSMAFEFLLKLYHVEWLLQCPS